MGLKTPVALLDMKPVFCTMDDIMMREQFKNISKGGVCTELVTPSPGSEIHSIFDNALGPRGGWEQSVMQCMPRLVAAGRLHCVR